MYRHRIITTNFEAKQITQQVHTPSTRLQEAERTGVFLTKQGKDGTCISEYDAQLLSQYKNQIRFAFFLLLGGLSSRRKSFRFFDKIV